MMDCKQIVLLLADYCNQQLTAAQEQMVTSHLKSCPHCQQEYQATKVLLEQLQSQRLKEPAASFWAGFLPQVKEKIRQKEKSWLKRAFLMPQLRYAMAVVVVVLVMAGYFYRQFAPTPSAPPMLTQDILTFPWAGDIFIEEFDAVSLPQASTWLLSELSATEIDDFQQHLTISSQAEAEILLATEDLPEEDILLSLSRLDTNELDLLYEQLGSILPNQV